MTKINEVHVIRSSLWAAYGDAVGFPTELISAAEFKKRNAMPAVSKPIAWRRRVGGLFGPEVEFPEGTYSDDTQLRLSTSRAITGSGFFDVESFAKIELPVWLNYALGAGRGSKAAATNLALRESSWSLNFFSAGDAKYWEGGGNGAAMRIQPHVWQNHNSPRHAFVSDVLRNSVCTHGHPRALIGAVIHAAMLFETMHSGKPIPPSDWADLGEALGHIALDVLEADPELPLVWIPSWERLAKRSLREAWLNTIGEWHQASNVAAGICARGSLGPAEIYAAVLKELGAFEASERGSGLKTPLYASVAAWLFRDHAPEIALATVANFFGSDTDTIATMAGALIGAVADSEPSTPIQDELYIRSEASRMFYIGHKEHERSFEYPDLLSWNAPRSHSDAWLSDADGERLAGIGMIQPFGPTYKSKKGTELVWQWADLEFGQTVLVKRRAAQVSTSKSSAEREASRRNAAPAGKKLLGGNSGDVLKSQKALVSDETQMPLIEDVSSLDAVDFQPPSSQYIDALTQQCIRGGFDPREIGSAMLSLMTGPHAIERAIAFAAIIAKAKVVRSAK